MKIVCLVSDPAIDNFLNPLALIHDLTIHHASNLSENEVVEKAKEAEVLITGPEVTQLRSSLLSLLPKLKLIAILTIGTDYIDLNYCREHNIIVSNIRGATSESVAEHIWAMILDLSKKISEFDRDARTSGAFDFSLYKGKEVYGKTLGVIGLGNIGCKVVRIAKSFDMQILGINKSGKPVDGMQPVDKETLLGKSDVIAVCIPLNEQTENYISTTEINLMKPGVIIVNCAREKIVNKDALLEGIKSGRVFGYGVETQIMKAVPKDDGYYKFPNILVVPHNAFNTEDGDEKSYKLVVENIVAFVTGTPQNVVG